MLLGERPGEEPDEPDWDDADPDETGRQNERCTECGEHGACGYDNEGRPMYHLRKEDDVD